MVVVTCGNERAVVFREGGIEFAFRTAGVKGWWPLQEGNPGAKLVELALAVRAIYCPNAVPLTVADVMDESPVPEGWSHV